MKSPDVQKELIEFVSDWLLSIKEPSVLEAGGGSLSRIRFPEDTHITVIDISQEQLDRNVYAHAKVLGDLHDCDFPSGAFDLIVCWDVLEHMDNPAAAVNSFMQCVRPGGLIVIAAPNPLSITGLITKFTPHGVHVWFYRTTYNSDTAGLPGHAPFPTFLRYSMSPRSLIGQFKDRGFEVLVSRTYSGRQLYMFGERHRYMARALSLAIKLFKFASVGRWNAAATNFVLVVRAPINTL